MIERTSIAKITRPKLSGIFPRERVFRLLDKARAKAVIWVAAPAGSGKTTLVGSWLDARKLHCLWYQVDAGDGDSAAFFYFMGEAAKKAAPRYKKPLPLLTPEYLQSVPVFTRRYFEELFRRLKAPAVLVFDNYQDAPQDSGFNEVISHALETVPDGITIVILSRASPPPQLARLQANNRLGAISWEDVRFTREESDELLKARGHGEPNNDTAALLHEKTEGWAAGIVLLMAGAGSSGSGVFAFNKEAPAGLFDYFASELFDKSDRATQDVLLKTSFLQRIEPADAEQLTGNGMAAQILEHLSRSHYFTQKYDRAYQYHPLFREFLQSLAHRTLSQSDIAATRGRVGALLAESGRVEEAIGMYLDAYDWDAAKHLLLDSAETLISQGRSNTLSGWLGRFPHEYVDGSAWLLYWGGICRMAFDPTDSRLWLEKAFKLFGPDSDPAGAYLSWAGIVDTFIYEWGDFSPLDRWTAVLEELRARHPAFPSLDIEARVAAGMLGAITYRQPNRGDRLLWVKRARQIVLEHTNVQVRMLLGNYLIHYYSWVGEFSQLEIVVEALRRVSHMKGSDSLTRQMWCVQEGMYSFFTADRKNCMQAVMRGLKGAEETGIHLLDYFFLGPGVYSGVSLGDPEGAHFCMKKMAELGEPARLMDKALYHYMASSVAWYDGDFNKAIEHGRLSVKWIEMVRCPLSHALCILELALTLFDAGQREEARKQLAEGEKLARGMRGVEFMHLLYGARFAFELGDEAQGVAMLKQGFALGAQEGYVNMSRWNDAHMSGLCAKALEHGIETDYVSRLIRIRALVPPAGSVKRWPWQVKIHTLGTFSIEKDGKPLSFTGKVQKKPLEMLKLLIDSGGEAREADISDILWPDADGDMAHNSFKMALSRLRNLIGKESIRNQDGKISLDSNFCWVDALAARRANA